MTILRSWALCLLLLLAVTPALAQKVTGEVVEVSATALKLKNGKSYSWSDSVTVRRGESRGDRELVKVGDRVEIGLDSQGRVKSVAVLVAAGSRLQIVDLGGDQVVADKGFNTGRGAVSIRGRIFDKWLRFEWATFRNTIDADLFECVIGQEQQDDWDGQIRFTVRAEDEVLYTSPWMTKSDSPIYLSLPIKGRQSVTLVSEWKDSSWTSVIWAEPKFLRLAASVPILALPSDKQVVSSDTRLVWQKAEGATGYLLEIQCIAVADAEDASDAKRFQAIQLGPDLDMWMFDSKVMPQGTYRWRVHALGPKAFIGEATTWRTFSYAKK